MPTYMFDKCNQKDLNNLEIIANLWGLNEISNSHKERQWNGQTNAAYVDLMYRPESSLPVLLSFEPDKSHLSSPRVKQMINDMLYALDAFKVYKGPNNSYDMKEFQ
jgi:hypothetical protein